VSYYRGDYYAGDFWGGLGRGIKRIGRDIGRVVKAAAPVAGILLPAVGAATLVGRGVAAAQKIKQTGRTIRSIANVAQQTALQQTAGGMTQAPVLLATPAAPTLVPGVAMPPSTSLAPSTTTAARRTRTVRAAYRRRKAAPKRRRPTTRRRRRRTTRRRS
jgi:hypothetical protein